MTRRYFVPELLTQTGAFELPDDEAAHAVRVMRVSAGDRIELFDGQGNQAAAEILQAAKRSCLCRVDGVVAVDREPSLRLTLAMAIPKPDRAKEMIERLTELGVATIQPLVFERTQRGPTDSLIAKLEKVVIQSCKQSGRNQLMSIEPAMTFAKWMAGFRATSIQGRAIVAMPGGGSMSSVLYPPFGRVEGSEVEVEAASSQFPAQSVPAPQPNYLAVIGPEGGLTDLELQDCLDSSVESVDLGKRILRIETAACLIASRILSD